MKLSFAAVVFIFVSAAVSQKPSPCPAIFSYEPRGSESDRWYGVVSLSTKEELSGVWLRLVLDRQADLIGNWFGETFSTDNVEYVIRNPKYKLEVGPPVSVRFFVKYNPSQPIPSLDTIKLNGKTICMAQKGVIEGPTEPTLHISQLRPTGSSVSDRNREQNNDNRRTSTRRPSNSDSAEEVLPPDDKVPYGNSGEDGGETNSEFFQGDFATVIRPAQNRPASSSGQVGSRGSSCGTVVAQAAALISHGQNTWPGQWPWHAAVYLSRGIQLQYICGGTLISEQHIVTAAHCVTRPRTTQNIDPNNLLIYLGKYKLIAFGTDVQDRGVSNIFVHPEYNYTVYFNDVAVLKLSRQVTITNFVRPCCLWEGDTNLDNILRQEGTVVGWGFDENRELSDKLMQAKMPIVATVDCIFSNRDFFSRFLSGTNFCAGFRNGTSACNGDSGGGMVFPRKASNGRNTVWQLRGLVSVGVALQGQVACSDTSNYVIFTDVAKYTHWIRQVVAK